MGHRGLELIAVSLAVSIKVDSRNAIDSESCVAVDMHVQHLTIFVVLDLNAVFCDYVELLGQLTVCHVVPLYEVRSL